ncbi:3-oxoadipate enol-lactonase [Rhizobium sp. SSA_523]|uniref:3-oxoadipate enol-lactonase n=1 Tax=Rhizobium sp. SSA_523 TaxID=2952477 RepID=UPI002091D0FF|nr:3-oxoadipate enol-lactonase [Rhizobium sp. SSA_523]MCO5733254.1 3-oxoadipate enol-lactonase [Rhizobium sp. SSA_523]WKC21760.1 3-oxoadipate enol-lactonase [Rhizobium sp. SSA_523]
MRFVRIGDHVLSHDIYNHGTAKPAIVFVNSLGTDRRIWDEVLAGLGSDYTLLTFDKRGHGLSDLGTPPYAIEDFSRDLAGLLDHYDIKNAVICGLSVGGLIALGLYELRPDLVRAVIFADTAAKIGTPELWNARIEAVLQGGTESILDPIMLRWFTPAYRRDDNADYRGYRNMVARQSSQGYAGTCAAIRDADFTETARRLAVPALCLVGDEDGSTPPEVVKAFADLLPHGTFHLIAGAGHIPCVETPDAFVAHLRQFIDHLPGE